MMNNVERPVLTREGRYIVVTSPKRERGQSERVEDAVYDGEYGGKHIFKYSEGFVLVDSDLITIDDDGRVTHKESSLNPVTTVNRREVGSEGIERLIDHLFGGVVNGK